MTVSATASGYSGKRAAIASGGASTCAKLPRRSGSDASSDVWLRRATNASCSGARSRACTWTLPVATVATFRRAARSASARLRARSCAQERPLQLDAQMVGPEGGQQLAQRGLVVYPVGRAAAQADEPGGALGHRGERQLRRHVDPPHARADQRLVAPSPLPARLAVLQALVDRPACVRVRPREQVTEVPPALLGLDQQREMAAVIEVDLRAVDRPHAERRGRLGELHRAGDAVVVGERHGLVTELRRGARRARPGSEAPSRNEKAEWAWSSTYIANTCSHVSRMDPASAARGHSPLAASAGQLGGPRAVAAVGRPAAAVPVSPAAAGCRPPGTAAASPGVTHPARGRGIAG